MTRAERRRLEREAGKQKQLAPASKYPVHSLMVGQRQLDKVKDDVVQELKEKIGAYYYEQGYEDGRKDAICDYCNLFYLLIGHGLHDIYGFKAKRSGRLFYWMDDAMREIGLALKEGRTTNEEVLQIAHDKLEEKTGLDYRLVSKEDEL